MRIKRLSKVVLTFALSICLFVGLIPGFSSNSAWAEPIAEQDVETDVALNPGPAESAGQTDPAETADPAETTDPVDPADPTEPEISTVPAVGFAQELSLFGAELPNHLIINQAAGVGNNADGAISHSFVEIYNPTNGEIDLSGYSLQYAPNGNAWSVLKLTGSIPTKHSYLVRANGSVTPTPARTYTIYYSDQDWGIVISNDSFKIALVDHQNPLTVSNPAAAQGIIDLIGAYNPPATVDYGEGDSPVNGASKQRSVRRVDYQDTDNNAADFISLHYGNIGAERIIEVRPCSTTDGPWDLEYRPPIPEPPVSGTITFSKSAGIFKTGFDLELNTATQGAVIYYTTDGSDPTPDNYGNVGRKNDTRQFNGPNGLYTYLDERVYDVSYKYEDPIEIKNRTTADEIAVQEVYTTGPLAFNGSYVRPTLGSVNKGTVVKAQLFTEAGEPISPVYVNSYFIEPNMADRYGGAPIISISAPRDYLFDRNFGIYQRGPYDSYGDYIYPDYRASRSYGNPVVYNFDQRGFEWERAAYVEVFDPANDGNWEENAAVSQGIGLRINGGNSRHSAQKALRLYSRTGDIIGSGADGETRIMPVHNGKSTIDHNFFRGSAKDAAGNSIKSGFKRLLLRASGNDINNAFMRHSLVNVIGSGTDVDTQAYRPSVVFINGEFWGFYEMLERYDDEYLVQHYGGSNNNYEIIENPSTITIGKDQASPESIAYFNNVVADIESVIATKGAGSSEVYAKVLEYVDENSLIDINIAETFFGNGDWVNKVNEGKGRYGNNQQMWRYTGPANSSPGQDGKYRWMLVDMDHSFDLSNGYGSSDLAGLSYAPWADTITYAIEGDNRVTGQASSISGADAVKANNYFFYVLMQNDRFREKFVNRYMDLLNTKLSYASMSDALDGIVAGMYKLWRDGEQKHRWSYIADYGSWQGMIGSIRGSMQQRTAPDTGIIDNSLIKYVDGTKELTSLTLINKDGNGRLKLNGIDLPDQASWTGKYFAGYEQTVEALPKSGYKFDHFEIKNSSGTIVNTGTEKIKTFSMLSGGCTVTAVYTEAAIITNPAPLIINQVFAGGPNDNTASITHSFIELYNPTDKAVSLAGWSLQVQNGNGNGTEFPVATEWLKYDFGNTVNMAPKTSLLIRLDEVSQSTARYAITDYDISWTVADGGRLLSNRSYSVTLVCNQTLLSKYITGEEMPYVVDLLGAKNTNSKDVSLNYKVAPYDDMSKQKSVRRIDFKNEGNNLTDFTSHDYRASGISDEDLAKYRPRWSGDGAWPVEEPPVVPVEGWLPDHLIINQAAGIGDVANDSNPGAIEYSFVELYNPTDDPVDISGWSLQYAAGGDVWEMLPLQGTIQARHSYLIRANGPSTNLNTKLFIPNCDLNWLDHDPNIIISNNSYKFAIVSHQNPLTVSDPAAAEGVIDLVGANNPPGYADFWEGTGAVAKMSKQQAARRQNFVDYDQNWYDFVAVDYRVVNVEKNRPRTHADGPWGLDLIPIPPPPSNKGTIKFVESVTGDEVPAGIYKEPFGLKLTTDAVGATIRYTLDGDEPTNQSPAYSDILPIVDRTGLPQLAWKLGTTGPRNEVSGYDRNLIEPTFNGTVVKARLFSAAGDPISDVYVNSYFVNGDVSELYGDLPIISVSTPADNLFGDMGIYVKGPQNEPYGPFNFDQKGNEWERSVYFEMFDPANGSEWETNAAVSQGLGLRIHGGASRHFPQKSLRFYARPVSVNTNLGVQPIINGKDSVDYDLFNGAAGVDKGFKRFMLRSAGNDTAKSYVRDSISNLLASDRGTVETQGYRFAAVFINGDFWGMYQLLERFDDEYLAQHYGGSAGNYRVLENPSPGKTLLEDNTADAIAYYEDKVAIVNAIEDMNTTAAYARLQEIVDIDSLIDYVIVETLGGNLDWVGFSGEWENEYGKFVYTGNNQRMWYYTGADDGQPGHDGKFRWMIYDTDKSWGYTHGGEYNSPYDNTIEVARCDNLFFFNKLMQNDLFRVKFVTSYLNAFDTWMSLGTMQGAADKLAGDIEKAVVEHKKRWPYMLGFTAWQAEIQYIKNWMQQRVDPNGAFVTAVKSYMVDDQTRHIVAYAGEEDTLPADVNWSSGSIAAFLNTGAYQRVLMNGTTGDAGLPVTAIVEVVPRNTAYFIDVGTSNQFLSSWNNPNTKATLYAYSATDYNWDENLAGSDEYNMVRNRLMQDYHRLSNTKSDQIYDGNWGVTAEGVQFPVARLNGPLAQRFMTGYVGFDNIPSYADKPKFLEYKLSLSPGEYKITTGHYAWWGIPGVDGAPDQSPRTLQVSLNDKNVTEPFRYDTFGMYDIITHDSEIIRQNEAGELSIKVHAVDEDGAVLTFIGVEDITAEDWYVICYVDWDYKVLKTQRVRDGLANKDPPDPSRAGYEFTGWAEDTQTMVGVDKLMRAQYEELPDVPVGVKDSSFTYVVYTGETPPLEEKAEVLFLSGDTEETDIEWDLSPLDAAKAYDTVQLTGSIKGYEGLTVTAIIEVIPRDLVYFIDVGTIGEYHPAGDREVNTGYSTYLECDGWYNNGVYYTSGPMLNGSDTYDLIKAKLQKDGKQLYNETSDKMFNDDRWGLTEEAYQFPVVHPEAVNRKLATGLVGWDDRSGPGYEDRLKYIEYLLWLPEGEYEITTGHYCWWNLMIDGSGPFGGFPRTMQILFNDVPMGGDFTFSYLGDNEVRTNNYYQAGDGYLSIKVLALNGGDGATLSFIGVEFTGEDRIVGIAGGADKYAAAYVGEADSLPKAVDVLYLSGKQGTADIVWDDLTEFMQAGAYDTISLTGSVAGREDLTFTMMIEVIPRNLVYFIDAAAVPEADKVLGWWGEPRRVRCFVEALPGVHPDDRRDDWTLGTNTSPAYDAVSALLTEDGAPLLNNAPDKLYDGSAAGWGVNPESYQFTVEMINKPLEKKFTSGYVGFDHNAGYAEKVKYIEYFLYLPKGKYEITTGHYDWWGLHGSNPRAMNIYFNDTKVYGPIGFGTFMDKAVVTNAYEQSADGILNIKIEAVYEDFIGGFKDGASLTFIGVEKTPEVPGFIYGDVNCDGKVDLLDATIFARWLAGWTNIEVFDERAADVDDDGYITPWDLTILQRYLAGWYGYGTLPHYN